ncbi:hypothetical protein DSUL_20017 [Desulfovibrionales bacterium]
MLGKKNDPRFFPYFFVDAYITFVDHEIISNKMILDLCTSLFFGVVFNLN